MTEEREIKVYVRDSLVKRGESWRMSFHAVYDDDTSGPRLFETLKGCRSVSRKAAVAEASRRLAEMSVGESRKKPDRGDATLASVLIEMADTLLRTKAIENSTYASYVNDARNLGFLGAMRPCDIKASDVIEYISTIVEDGSIPAARRGLKTVRRGLAYAVEKGLADKNVAKGIRGPKSCDDAPKTLQDKERRSLVKVCADLDGPLPLAIRIALSTGLRRGEVCGLQWRDIDFRHKTLSVSRSIGEDQNGHAYVKEPKSSASRRTLPLEEGLLRILEEEKAAKIASCVPLGIKFENDFYVIGSDEGRFMHPKELGRRFAHLAESFDIADGKCRFHWLRHTFASALLSNGVDIRTVSAWLGHSDPGFTLQTYVDLDQEAMRRSVIQVEKLFSADGCTARPCENYENLPEAHVEVKCSSCPYRGDIPRYLRNIAEIAEASLNSYDTNA